MFGKLEEGVFFVEQVNVQRGVFSGLSVYKQLLDIRRRLRKLYLMLLLFLIVSLKFLFLFYVSLIRKL